MALTIDHRPVLDAADLMRRADKDLRKQMNAIVRREVNPWLQSAIRRNAGTDLERAIASTARIRGGTNPAVVVGGAKRLSGGARASQLAGAVEFGAYNPYRKVTYSRRNRRSSGTHRVKRSTAAQIPPRSDSGRFIMAAVADAAPMLVGAWVRAIIDAYNQEP